MNLPPFLRFALVGALGFLVDLAMLWLGLEVLHLGVYVARLVSFAVTVTFTWVLNRHVTFAAARARDWPGMGREWLRFVVANSLGLAANYGIYAALVSFGPGLAGNPYFAAGSGSLTGLVINYLASKRLVFGANG